MGECATPENDTTSEHTVKLSRKSLQQPAPAATDDRGAPSILVLTGPEAGRLILLKKAEYTIGRDLSADVNVTDLGVSRWHVSIFRNRKGVSIQDLDSANGTLVNGHPAEGKVSLNEGDKIAIGTSTVLEFAYQDETQQHFYRKLKEESLYDDLTGAYTRKFFFKHLESEIAFAERHGTPLGLIMCDLDNFKEVNDTYGHPVGDEILKEVSHSIESGIRAEDILCRYGGEEFAILCRDNSLADTKELAERLRQQAAHISYDIGDQMFRVTVSFGVTAIPEAGVYTSKELIAFADWALYKAKKTGRNCVCDHSTSQ